ncbi:MAG: glycosyltransferase family 2 protein [Nitrospirae bacterium]|nr:glycosyltransferase family 2 protein [Nitrospirota bacterium]
MSLEKYVSVVIPNYNSAETIGKCLEAAFASRYGNFEVIVVDDHSEDNSIEIIKRFPCRLISLDKHSGASKARNTGAFQSRGEIIFFTDSDCLLNEDTLSIINSTFSKVEPHTIVGGTYAKKSYDKGFFNLFQSLFVYYSETKNAKNPDYIAAHAMVIDRETFRRSKGFPEKFLPIIEDVEFTHRLKREGCILLMNPEIQVRHIFNFTFYRSMKNAVRKSKYWVMYSMRNKDMFTDSGSSSTELKVNVASAFLSLLLLALWILSQKNIFLYPLPFLFICNLFVSKGLIMTFYETGGALFIAPASIYYTVFYSLSVGTGTIAGMAKYFLNNRNPVKKRPK